MAPESHGVVAVVVTSAAMGLAGLLTSISSVTAASPGTTTPSAPPLYGVTIDNVGNMQAVLAAESALPERPMTRVYFNVSEPASYYMSPVSQLHSVSGVMGELLDSSDATRITTSAFQSRVESYLSDLGSSVDIWEIGNEVNGDWTGPYATGAEKIDEAYDDVEAAGASSALTLYANEFAPNNCGDGTAELTPLQFSEQYVPVSVRDGLTYVFESYYPTQCHNTYPTSAQVSAEMQQLHAFYPNALLGFGEVGLARPVKTRTLAKAAKVMSWAYRLAPRLRYYVGGYFWWYTLEDAFTGRALLRSRTLEGIQSRGCCAPVNVASLVPTPCVAARRADDLQPPGHIWV